MLHNTIAISIRRLLRSFVRPAQPIVVITMSPQHRQADKLVWCTVVLSWSVRQFQDDLDIAGLLESAFANDFQADLN